MKKIILLSFYFSPCTLTPSQRITYWAKNLHKIGLYPIVITREWDANLKSHAETKIPLGGMIRHEKFEFYEVYYLPFIPGILDKAYLKWGETSLRSLFLSVKILDLILVNFTLKFTSYANFFPFLRELHQKEGVLQMIISGEPFYLFKLGFMASKKLGIRWIADYRDDWTTNELQKQKGGSYLRGLILKMESKYEQKWVKTAEYLTSVSEVYTQRISRFLGLRGITIANGFEEELLDLPQPPLFDEFTLVYSGTLYPSQNIDVILDTLRLSIERKKPFQLIFLGAGFDIKEKKRLESMIEESLQPFVKITDRLPRNEAIEFLQKSHAVLGISYGTMKGIPSSKLYEYIGLGKPVLLCPTDHDVMQETLSEVGLGFFADDAKDCLEQISQIKALYANGRIRHPEFVNRNKILKYSRHQQMTKFVFLAND